MLIPKRGLAIGRVQKSLSSTTLPSSLQLSIGLRNKPLVYCFSTIPCIRKQKGKKQNNPLQNLSILSNILLSYSQHSCTKACRTNKSKHMQTMLNVYQAKKNKNICFLNSVEVACWLKAGEVDRGAIKKKKLTYLKNKRKIKVLRRPIKLNKFLIINPKLQIQSLELLCTQFTSQLGVWDLALCEMLKMLTF